VVKYRTTLFSYSITVQRNFITCLVPSLKPRTKQAPVCFMLICTICSHILKDNQAAFNVNNIRPNTTKISGLILLLVVCCLQVFWVYIYRRNLTRLKFNTLTCNIRMRRLKKRTKKCKCNQKVSDRHDHRSV